MRRLTVVEGLRKHYGWQDHHARLRGGPARMAHVIVKLGFTALSLGVLVLAGARSFGPASGVPLVSFAGALLFTTLCLLSIGFIIASLEPTARFAPPLATLVVYTMLGFPGLFVSLDRMPASMQWLARLMPMSHAVSLLRGIWHGEGWLAHAPEAGILAVMFLALTTLASRVFRWE